MPEPPNKPGPGNTGVPAGTKLTVFNGDLDVTQAGRVINGLEIKGQLEIEANNVTVENSLIEGRSGVDSVFWSSGTNLLMKNDEVTAVSPSVATDDMSLRNATVEGLNIHGGVDGIKLEGADTILDSYIHGLSWFPHDPAQDGGPTHNDTIQILSSTDIHVSGNYLDAVAQDNSAIQVTQDRGSVSGLTITANWADGGGCTFNFSSHNHNGTRIGMSGITVDDNRFGTNSKLSCAIVHDLKTTLSTAGNVYDATGLPVTIVASN